MIWDAANNDNNVILTASADGFIRQFTIGEQEDNFKLKFEAMTRNFDE